MGLSPLDAEGDRSMFSADAFLAKHVFPPKNGPVPNQPLNGHQLLQILTQGTRGETGRRWCERIWTVLAGCAQRGRSAFEFLYHSIVAHFRNQASPSLVSVYGVDAAEGDREPN